MYNKNKILFILLLVFILTINISANTQKSLTWDEPLFILNGLYYLEEGTAFNSNQPLLSSIISATPLVFLDIEPLEYEDIDYLFKDAKKVFPYYKNNDLDTITFWSHIGFILFSLIFAYFVYKWGKELYGKRAGLFALFLYTFSVTILAWTTSATPDFLSVGLMFISLYYFWKYLNKDQTKFLIYSSIFLGLATAAKITALFLLPIFFINYLIYYRQITIQNLKKIIKTFLIIGIISFLALSLVHIKDIGPLYDTEDPFYQNEVGGEFRTEERLEGILDNYISEESSFRPYIKSLVTEFPLPAKTFFQALYTHSQDSVSSGRASFMFGEWKIDGWWYYYIIVFLIKVPIPIILFFLLSLLYFKKAKHHDIKNELYLIIPILVWFILFSFVSRIDAGIRHMLLMFPFIFLLSSKLIKLRNNKLIKYTLILLSIWLVLTTLLTFPFYVSYFNETVGGSENGYKLLGAGNVDLGQDMIHIEGYLEDNQIDFIKLHYNGVETPDYRNINYELIDCNETEGLIMISAGVLQGASYNGEYRNTFPDQECFFWLYNQTPIDNIGGSILIYNHTIN